MSRPKLIKFFKQKNPTLNKSEINTIIDIFCKSLSDSLKKECPVEIRGFGTWKIKRLKENFNARNPNTNELIYKPERVKVRFKASKKLNKIINE